MQQAPVSSSSSTSSDDEPSLPPKKPSQKRKTPELELSEDDLGGPLRPSDTGHCSSSEQAQTAESSAKGKSKGKKSKKKST